MASTFRRPERSRIPLGARGRLSYERRVYLSLWIFALDTLAAVALLLAYAHASLFAWVYVMVPLALAAWFAVTSAAQRLVRPLQTLANVLVALRVGDYSLRVRGGRRGDSLGDLAIEINALASDLQGERLYSMESSALLQRVLAAVEAPVMAFDPEERLVLMNPSAERVLPAKPRGQTAEALGMRSAFAAAEGAVLQIGLRGSTQWLVHRSSIRLHGRPHTLLLLADVSRALREEERIAWQRLIRVLGHEINNSLTPIKSLAGSLRTMVERGMLDSEDLTRGLAVIEARADSLNRFLRAYRQVAQLPSPQRQLVSMASLLERVVLLEDRVPVQLHISEAPQALVDPDMLEQALINLLRNAAEATLCREAAAQAAIEVRCAVDGVSVAIDVLDHGMGIANPTNLFVPFYTTKEQGSGLGLMLVKQIAEAHAGTITLSARPDGKSGTHAQLRLPSAGATSHRNGAPDATFTAKPAS